MKRLFALLSLTLSITALAGNPYVGANITRTYYQSELESCPGVLDMQPGDLWTLTFPDTITDSFLTRDGLVERKVQDNRVVMAVTATSGTSPMLVMTEDGHALRFMITIQGGVGGRNKNVVIKPGWGRSSACAGARPVTSATSAAPVTSAPTLTRVSVPSASAAPIKSAARPPVTLATPLPTKAVKAPTPPLTARKPVSPQPVPVKSPSPQLVSAPTITPTATPHAQTPIPATVSTPAAPTPTVTLEASTAPTRATPAAPTPTVTLDAPTAFTPATPSTLAPRPGRASPILASSPTYLTATVMPEAQGRLLSIRITSRLDADVMLDEQDLTVGDATSTSRRRVMVPAGQDITLALHLQGPLPKHQGRLLWTGHVLGSGETFLISATLPLPA